MGKSKSKKEETNQNIKCVSVGFEAQSFYDSSTGIQIARGEVKELTPRQYNSPKIKRALTSGHLVFVVDIDEDVNQVDNEELKEKFKALVDSGMEVSKIAEAFTFEEISRLAEDNGVEVEEGDTVTTIIEALIN